MNYNRFSLLTCLFLILSNYGFSQHIIVDYKAVPNGKFIESQNDATNSGAKDLINEVFKLVEFMTLRLKATQTESIFWGTTEMNTDVDDLNFRLAKLFVDNDSEYKCDLNNDLISRWSAVLGKKFIVNNKISNLNWKLTKEKKQIGIYNCYKASCTYEIVNSSGVFKKNVEAWYTIEIPYRFGPRGYCGLPGLILELTDNKVTYVVKNISFEKNNIAIGSLPDGDVITQEELNDLASKAMEERRSKIKRKE